MTIQQIDPNLIDPNPYQPRQSMDGEQLQRLADDIRERGLLQPPAARPHPDQPERYQLAFGHRRHAAWKIAFPGQPISVEITDLTNRQMFEYSIVENDDRQDLTSIERARGLQTYIQEFKVTQADAGKLFGLASQGAVSNLLRLLQLPEQAQALVNSGDVPERLARQLVPLAKIAPDKVGHIAHAIAKADIAEKEDMAEKEMLDVLSRHCTRLDWPHLWPAEWKSTVAAAPSCRDCIARIHNRYGDHCGDQSCYAVKVSEWTDRELERISAKTGIPIRTPDETVHVLDIHYDQQAKVKAWVKSKAQRPNSLRLVPNDDKHDSGFYHTTILGSPNVLLASTVKSILDRKTDEIRQEKIGAETNSEKSKREAAEAREREKRRDARSAQRKAQSDICWLIFHTAKLIEPQMTIDGGVLDYAAHLCYRFTNNPTSTWNEYVQATCEFKGKESYWDKLYDIDNLGKITSSPPDEKKRRYILIREFAGGISGYNPETQFDWKRACEAVKDVSAKFRLTLPNDWDKPPIHHTSANCWVCGRFTSMDHITKIDEASGWQIAPDGTVTCSDECRQDAASSITKAEPPQRKTKRGAKK